MYASSPLSVSAALFLLLVVSVLKAAEAPIAVSDKTPMEVVADTPQGSTVDILPPTAAEPPVRNVLQTPEDVYAAAIGHYSNSRWRQAAEEFSRFAQLYPSHPQAASALFFRAEAAVQQGQYAQARKDFLDFVAREPNHRYVPQARFRAAEAVYLTGDSAMARQELEQFAAEYPDASLNAHAKTYLAELALSAQDGPRAAALFKEVLERHPDGAQVDQCRFGLGRASELRGDIESARIAYQTLAAAGGPLADDAQVQLGICLYNRGKYTEAEAAFQAAAARFPGSELLAQARYWLGMSQVARHDWDNAVLTLQAALEQYPQHALTPAMTFWRAEACRQRGELPSAQEGYDRVLQNWPDSPWADDSVQAQVQLTLADAQYERVASLAEQFVTQFPYSPLRSRVEQSLARAYLKQNQYGQAIELLKRLVASASAPKPAAAPADGDAGAATAGSPPEDEFALQANQYYLTLAYLGDAKCEKALEVLTQVNVPPEKQDLYGGVQWAHALALAGLNRQAEAIEVLQKYLATGPTGSNATACRLELMEALAHENRLDEALQVHAQITGQDAQQAPYAAATHRLAESALTAGKVDAAMGLFGVIVQDGQPPELADKGWTGLGLANFQAGKAEAAVVAFDQVIERHPESPLAVKAAMMKAKALEQLGRSDEVLEAYLLVVTSYGDSEEAAPALLEAARVQEKLGRKAEAIPLLQRIVREHPDFQLLDAVLYQLAWLLSDQGQGDEADRVFEQIAEQHRDSVYWADGTYRLAQRAAAAEQYDRARQLADRLTQADCTPEIRSHALFLQGQLAASTQRWAGVSGPMQELLKQFPDSPLADTATFWVAEAYYQQKEYEAALEWFAKLEPAELPGEEAWRGMILLRRAQILAEQQNWQQAYQLANGIEERFPKVPQQYEVDCLLGRCLAQQGNFAAAVPRYERVIRSPEGGRTETAAMAQWLIGEAFAAQRDLEQALKAYYRVDTLFNYPTWKAAALVQAGKCHELRGERADAANVWGQVVAKYSDTPYAQEAAKRLQRLNSKVPAPAAMGVVPASRPIAPTSRAMLPASEAAGPARKETAAAASFTAPAPVGPQPQNATRNARRRTLSQP